MRIAVDFDGTIVENQYPAIGVEKAYAVETLKQLAAEGDEIILWTARCGQYLQDAVEWCEERGLIFSAVNSNYHTCISHQNGFSGARKIHVDIFIDDKNIGGIPNWPKIYLNIKKLKHRLARDARKRRRQMEGGLVSRLCFYLSLRICPPTSRLNIPDRPENKNENKQLTDEKKQ